MFNLSTHRKQRTIVNKVSIKGTGLHTGVETVATFKPAKENFGIRFKRLDLKNCPEIVSDIDHVIDISRGTTIGQNNFRIHTVEHILAAIFDAALPELYFFRLHQLNKFPLSGR